MPTDNIVIALTSGTIASLMTVGLLSLLRHLRNDSDRPVIQVWLWEDAPNCYRKRIGTLPIPVWSPEFLSACPPINLIRRLHAELYQPPWRVISIDDPDGTELRAGAKGARAVQSIKETLKDAVKEETLKDAVPENPEQKTETHSQGSSSANIGEVADQADCRMG